MLRKATIVALTLTATAGGGLPLVPAQAQDTASITGVAFEDVDRDGTQDAGESVFSGHTVHVYDTSGAVASTTTDSTGAFRVNGLPPARYTVTYGAASWSQMQRDYVPTTTGSARPEHVVDLTTDFRADFGWRRIVWSTSLRSPISIARGSNGVRIETFNDAVSASEVLSILEQGTLLGSEGASVTVRVGWGDVDHTAASTVSSGGTYTGYSATSYVTWSSWLGNAAPILFHEYGHAWSEYFEYLVQQDPSLSGYLEARGLTGDPRVGSGYTWNPHELIAEDYRQLFGDPVGRAQAQANTHIPPAAQVPGLAEYLSGAFRSGQTSSPAPPSVPTPTVSALTVNPDPVRKSGTVSFELSTPASVTVQVQTAAGDLVQTLLSGDPRSAGSVSVTWKRTTSTGARAKAGSYRVVVIAANESGSASQVRTFSVA